MLQSYDKELQSHGCKVTPQRSLILDILHESQAHTMTAEEIVGLARVKQPNISAGTVYRNLNTLCELGLLKCLDSVGDGRHYELNTSHHHHLVCLGCRQRVAIDFCPMNREVRELAEKSGFAVADHNFEVKGYCTKCRPGAKQPPSGNGRGMI